MTLKVGDKAPDFKVKDQEGKTRTLKDFKGKYLILYFYPKDLTPGCTTEACSFNDKLKEINKLGAEILGVSCDPAELHQKFIAKHKLKFPLLSDIDKEMVESYGVWGEKSMYGKKYMGIKRESFLIGPELKILKHYPKVKPATHADEIIADLKELKKRS